MSCLCDLFFISSLISVNVSHITSVKETHLFFLHSSQYLQLILDYNVDEESEQFSNRKGSVSGCCLAFPYFFSSFSLALLIKMLLIEKACSCPS